MSRTSGKAWFESFFGEEYFEMYRDAFPEERTVAEVDGIVSLLGLEPGACILDLACGHGRHSIALAMRGFEVTGYDLSDVFLDRARADAEAQGVAVRWVRGDMRELHFEGEFDAAINVFTAFGYFEDPEDDLRALRGIRAALRPGGRFLLETLHRDGLPARFEPRSVEKTSSGTLVLHERDWDLARDVMNDHVTVIRPDGTRSEYRTAVRMLSLHTLLGMMKEADLEPQAWCGGLDGSELHLGSRRLVLISARQP
jgi:SAM-dependent methyltransferase